MNRLWLQLTLAVALVILVVVGSVALLANLTAGRQFLQYLSLSGTWPEEALVERLSLYYASRGTWRGVDTVLEQATEQASTMPRMMSGMRRGEAGPVQIVLADASGQVLYDGLRQHPGRRLSRDEQAVAEEIVVDGQGVGRLVVAVPTRSNVLGPLEQGFLVRLRRWLAIGALLAVALAVLLVLGLSRNLTAPLRRLAEAARAVANRDFSRRVETDGSAEVAEVAVAFNDMARALERSERQRQDLVADVAHELRTPLAVVQGSLRAILDDVYPLEKAEISRLYDETRLLSRLVDDLKELALADSGQLQLSISPVDPAGLIRSAVDRLSLAAEAGEVTLVARADPELREVRADPDRLAQVLRNLLVNALQHTPLGGTVTVSAVQLERAVEFAVTDSGEGIAPEDLPYLFDRFWRADRSRKRADRSGGTGLGLSIAQSLVQGQGGRIWAESELGKGTSVRFTVPCVDATGTQPVPLSS